MRKNLIMALAAVCLVILVAALGVSFWGQEFGEGRVIRRAIEAHGGAPAIRGVKAARLKGHGIRHGGYFGPATFAWEEWVEYPQSYKLVIQPKAGWSDTYLKPGKKWWRSEAGGKPQPLPGLDDVHPINQQLDPLRQLLEVRRQNMPVEMVGNDEVHFRPAVSVRAHSDEWGQVLLTFDKANGLLLRMKGQLDREGLEPIRLERVYSQHKEVHGVVIPMKVALYRNGLLEREVFVTDVELLDRLDPAIFAAPQ